MKIKEAIEILTDIIHYVRRGDPPEEHDAIELGIEALKKLRDNREYGPMAGSGLLPGEPKGSVRRS